ncbi:uncharacterized protein H6S33_005498 [Morchella sextelata]|uniref:uncharacterized protein n=1 Tax=Morchella sextelata TaxID=1174677 RepID=UPI001D041D71|nr:uncharacterized protein H6S33_005498 [Morchella sextelata]KAH0613612.1 hypothetical protein H6S33_005498 [Morchella sextelata]
MAPTKKSRATSTLPAPRKMDVYNSTSTGHQVGDGVSKPAAYQRHRAARLQAQFGGAGAGGGGGGGSGGQATLLRYLASAKAAGGKQKVLGKKVVADGKGPGLVVLETVVNSRDTAITARRDITTTTISRKDTTWATVSRDTATAKDITTATTSSKDTTTTAISRDTATIGDATICSPTTATGSLKTPKKEAKAPAPATSSTTARGATRDTATTARSSTTTARSPKAKIPKAEEGAVIDIITTATTSTTIAPTTTKASPTPPQQPKQLFHPLTIHISGATTPHISDHALKRLLARHGARIAPSISQRSTTHVIIGGGTGAGGVLAAGKLQKELLRRRKNVRFVGVAWALDSVKAGRRLPEGRYAVGVKAGGQKSVGEVFGVKAKGAEGSGKKELEGKEAEGSSEKEGLRP